MKNSASILFVAAVLLLFHGFSQAQTTAVPFLLVPPAPEGVGIGGGSASLPTTDALAPLVNPGQLGLFSFTNHFSAATYAPKSDWLPQFQLSGMSYGITALNAGYNFRSLLSLPFELGVGIGYSRISLDLGTFSITGPGGPVVIGTFQSKEYSDNYSLGVGLDYVVRLGLGFNFKNITSELAPTGMGTESGKYSTGKSTATDFGLLVDVPVAKIVSDISGTSLEIAPRITPFLDVSWAYVKANVGSEISYIEGSRADPLPRTAVIGMSLGTGISMKSGETAWQIVSLRLAHQAEDLLVTRRNDGTIEYKSGSGGIQFWDDVVIGNHNRLLTSRRGWQIQLAEFFSWRQGSVESPGLPSYSTSGFSICLGGVLKGLHALGVSSDDNAAWLVFAMKHMDIQFHSGKYDQGSSSGGHPAIQSLNLVIKGFSL